MNDEKYMYFTERIQNFLIKPEVLRAMNEGADLASDLIEDKKLSRKEQLELSKSV